MRIKVLGSSIDVGESRQFAASYVVNGSVAIDAGSIGLLSSIDEQRSIEHVLISHSHWDHVGSLPIFLDNVYQLGPMCPTVHGSEAVRECLFGDIFNERLWPDLIRISKEESPFLRFDLLEHRVPKEIGSLQITPVELDHVIPTHGFLIDDGDSAVAIVSDTGPTDEIWSVARNCNHLKAVFLESAFPNSMAWLAEKAGHLTPSMFLDEYQKLGSDLPVYAIHIKPAFYEEVIADLHSLDLAQLHLPRPNAEYEF